MREMDLPQIDLNLLVALDALLAEMNVTRAAHRLWRERAGRQPCFGAIARADLRTRCWSTGRAVTSSAPALEEVRPVLRRDTWHGIGEMLGGESVRSRGGDGASSAV